MYTAFIHNDDVAIASEVRSSSSKFFIRRILTEYLSILTENNNLPLKLAFGISDNKILVWSEIEDDDEQTEDAILLAEAKINAQYHSKGIFISSIVVEKSDNLPVPPHYQIVAKK